jgi:LacI family transcriptional regulator
VLNYDATLAVSAETKKKVFEVAEALAYEKRSNRKVKSAKIALIHWCTDEEELDDLYYMSIRLGIESKCRQCNLGIVKFFSSQIEELRKENVQGIIAVGKFSQGEIAVLREITPHVVFVDSSPEEDCYDSVGAGFANATKRVLDYLLGKGHSRIGYIGGREVFKDKTSAVEDPREETFVVYLREKALFDPGRVYLGNFSVEDGYRLMKRAIDEQGVNLPTAFFVGNDSMAIGCLKALGEAGIRVPDQVNIIGVNDISISRYISPALSTVKVDTKLMGETAVELLLERFNGRSVAKKVILATELIIRQSSF